jgi:hypothetical protein
VAGVVIAVPEITAAFDGDALWFTTISAMVGHLEFLWSLTELFVIAAIVLALFATVRKPPPKPQPGTPADSHLGTVGDAAGEAHPIRTEDPPATSEIREPQRTPGGRLALTVATATEIEAANFDAEQAPLLFVLAAVVALTIVSLGTWAAVTWWNDARHFHPAYVLYGSLGLLWLVIPNLVTFWWGSDPPYPTLFRTVKNLEDWLSSIGWKVRSRPVGPMFAWFVSFLIVWGLVVLLLHLTLYPFPDITHILDPKG